MKNSDAIGIEPAPFPPVAQFHTQMRHHVYPISYSRHDKFVTPKNPTSMYVALLTTGDRNKPPEVLPSIRESLGTDDLCSNWTKNSSSSAAYGTQAPSPPNSWASYIPTVGSGSSVGIATGYGLDGPGIESRWGGARFSASIQSSTGAHPASCTMVPGLSRG